MGIKRANPTLSGDAKTALLTGSTTLLKLKMLEHNPTPSLAEMIEFTQRFCALGRPTRAEIPTVQVDAVAHSSTSTDPQVERGYYLGCWHRRETASTREPHETYREFYLYPILYLITQILLYMWFTRSFHSGLYVTAGFTEHRPITFTVENWACCTRL